MNRPSDIAVAAAFWEAYGDGDLLPSTLDDLFSRARELDTEPRAGDGGAFSPLVRYGRHDADCAMCHDSMHKPKPVCSCGYAAAIAAQRNEGDGDAVVRVNYCACHPETCCCSSHRVIVGEDEVVMTGSEDRCKRVAQLINDKLSVGAVA